MKGFYAKYERFSPLFFPLSSPSKVVPLAYRCHISVIFYIKIQTLMDMVDNLPFGEGDSINRSPLFCGVNYQFWKVRMEIFVE